jgi:DNA-binding NarL/FixJ family response regulator
VIGKDRAGLDGNASSSNTAAWKVVLLTRDVSLDEAQDAALDVPRMSFRGSVGPASRDARPTAAPPDLVVLDCVGVEDHGLHLLVGAHRRWPEARVLLLSAPEDPAWLAQAVRLGVRGALPQGYEHEQVREAAERIRQGELWFSRRLTQEILSIELQEHRSLLFEHLAESPDLTDRERDVARHAVQGMSHAEIAAALGLEEPAVKDLMQRAYRKLRANHRSELILRLALVHRGDAG